MALRSVRGRDGSLASGTAKSQGPVSSEQLFWLSVKNICADGKHNYISQLTPFAYSMSPNSQDILF